MQKAKIFVVVGFWIAILPHLGFPILVKNILFSITGFVLVYIGLVLRSKISRAEPKKFDNFSENTWHEKPIPMRPIRQKLESIKEKVADINNTF
ncbi:MAG: hypothetical protein ACKOW9_05805 [Candidatus Paceibacterota bacterium]